MKTTKELKIWSLRMVLFTILLSGLSVQKVYSFCNSTEIIINGKWYSNQEKVNTLIPQHYYKIFFLST